MIYLELIVVVLVLVESEAVGGVRGGTSTIVIVRRGGQERLRMIGREMSVGGGGGESVDAATGAETSQIGLELSQMLAMVLALLAERVASARDGHERPLERFRRAARARQRRRREHGRHQVDRAHPVVQLVRVRRLEQVLGPVGRLESKHELLLLVVARHCRQRVMYAYGVRYVVERLVL